MIKIKLSPYQKTFYNEWKLTPKSSNYNIVFDQTLSSSLDVLRLRRALYNFVSDHIIFNSHVTMIGDDLYWEQNVGTNEEGFLTTMQLSNEMIQNYVTQPFDLENNQLCRFAIFSDFSGNYRVILVFHHILIDASSFDQLILEISKYYNNAIHKAEIKIEEQIKQITIVTEKLNKQLELHATESKIFWANQLSDVAPINLKFITKNTNVITIKKIKELRFNFTEEITQRLDFVKNKYNITQYWYSQIIFAILLNKYTFQTKFAISYPISIKEQSGLIYGSHVNTNLFPYEINEYTSTLDLIMQVSNHINKMKIGKFNHGYYPINDIVANINKEFLDVFFTQTNLKDMKLNFHDVKTIKINHDFNIDLLPQLLFEQEIKTSIINFRVKYNAELFDESILQKFVQHYKKLFVYILNDLIEEISDRHVLQYPILDTTEYQQIVYKWNQTEKSYPKYKTIHQLFEEQVEKTPNTTAIICEAKILTYQELNNHANQLANYLRINYEIKGDDLVAFYLNKSHLILIAMFAILKSGAGYVPINTEYPDERIGYILQDTRAKAVLTNIIHLDKLNHIAKETSWVDTSSIIAIDDTNNQSKINIFPIANLDTNITSKNLAYVIYTSGTTGLPKGVTIEHMSVVNYLNNIKEKVFNNGNERVDFSTNISFDLTVTTTLGALCAGCEVYVYSGDIRDIDVYKRHLIDNKIIIVKVVPSYLDLFLDILPKTNITKIILGGEKISKSCLDKINKTNLIIYDEYGPTEATVGSCLSKIYSDGKSSEYLTIGTPYNNYKTYVLDVSMKPLPIGAVGALYIGGDGLARGYLNNIELTSKNFLSNPYQSEEDKIQNVNNKLYKTGDMVRYLPNGELEYLGRGDSQIKIKGFRIEPSEIEIVINHYSGVKQSVVVTSTQLNNSDLITFNEYLVAYYVSDCKLDEISLSNYLAMKLPYYMLPEVLIHIVALPLTINGKLDKSALPGPNLTKHSDYAAPRNSLEIKICEVYSELLKLSREEVGINHDFFKLGGNSISAIHLVYRLQHELKISLNDVFKFRTPAMIAEAVPIARENLRYKLKQMKLVYNKLAIYEEEDNVAMKTKKLEYLEQIKHIKLATKQRKNIRGVLLTGASGHLGCHILYQLLFETEYKVYLLVRAASNEDAYNRVNEKFKFYFDNNLNRYLNRIIIFTADIEKPNLGLNLEHYNELVSNIDSIIHAAGLVKHYGEYSSFFQTNVQATINLLELSKLTTLKDFHYISTLSVLTNGHVPNCHYYIFTENDNEIILDNSTNIYSQTKYEGELSAITYRNFGINSSIYRVGNLSMNSKNYRNQSNITENAFFTKVKTVLNLGVIPKEMSEVEISPVDQTALAIVKLFDKVELGSQTYHISNPHISNLFELLLKCKDVKIKTIKFNKFIDKILAQLDDKSNNNQIELFMLHQSWLEEVNLDNLTRIIVLQDKTNFILNELGFSWSHVTSEMLSDVISQSLLTKSIQLQ